MRNLSRPRSLNLPERANFIERNEAAELSRRENGSLHFYLKGAFHAVFIQFFIQSVRIPRCPVSGVHAQTVFCRITGEQHGSIPVRFHPDLPRLMAGEEDGPETGEDH